MLALLWRPGLKPLGMAGLAEELGFVIAPCLDGAFGVPRNGTAAGALEMSLLGLALGQELADQGQDNNSRDDNSNNGFQ